MDKQRALAVVEGALAKIPSLRTGRPGSVEHMAFVQTTGMQLARVFGSDSPIVRNFSSITYQPGSGYVGNLMTIKEDMARRSMGGYLVGLNMAEGVLQSARELLTEPDVDEILRASRIKEEGARVFVSHGGETEVLTRVERFVRSLGLQPIVVVRGPSEGMAVDDLVNVRMEQSDCAIVLATADDKVGECYQPRPNVLHEIGVAQEKLGKRVIYLKEERCQFPSNVSPKVWQTFTRDNLESAFDKIAKELRAFDLL